MGGASRASGMRWQGPLRHVGVALLAALLVSSVSLVALAGPGVKPAEAAFPGENGRIAYEQYPLTDDETYDPDIYTANPDGSDPRQLVPGGRVSRAEDPAYSADGEKIAFVGKAPDPSDEPNLYTWQVFVVEVDAQGNPLGEPVMVTHDLYGWPYHPSFSPDGEEIAYEVYSGYKGSVQAIYTSPSDGTGERTLVAGGSEQRQARDPAWSPDGQKIAYAGRYLDDPSSGSDYDIYTVDVDGSGSPNGTPARIADGYENDSDPDWSPDGQKIAYTGWDESLDPEVFVVGATTGAAPRQVTDGPGSTDANVSPSFSPDGEEIAYENGAQVYIGVDNGAEVYRIDADAERGTGTPVTEPGPDFSSDPSWGRAPTSQPPPPPVNAAPEAKDDAYETSGGGTLTVPAPGVLANDIDADGDELTAGLVAGTKNGTLDLAADGSFTYAPREGYEGTDSFTYEANDGEADSGTATVEITVAPSASPPPPPAPSPTPSPTPSPPATPPPAPSPAPPPPVPDTDKPTITKVRPKPGRAPKDRSRDVKATIQDARSELSEEDIRLFLDGEEVTSFTYDPETGKLRYDAGSKLSVGRHTVEIEATDEAGNTETRSYSFKIRR